MKNMQILKEFAIDTGIRTTRTFCQTMLGFVVAGKAFTEITWTTAFSVSGVAAVACVLTCISAFQINKNKSDKNVVS